MDIAPILAGGDDLSFCDKRLPGTRHGIRPGHNCYPNYGLSGGPFWLPTSYSGFLGGHCKLDAI